MKKSGLLLSLETLRIQSEALSDDRDVIRFKLFDILLDYIGDKEIREKVDEIVL